MAWSFVIDATSEDASNVPLDISDGTSYRVREPVGLPEPEKDSNYVRVDEGEGLVEHHYQNRTITLPMWVTGTSADNLASLLASLSKKVAKLDREGGTLKVTTGAADVVVFDLLAAQMETGYTTVFNVRHRAEVTLTFTAKPFGRGAATQLADHTEITLPCLIFTEQDIPGDVPALGKLVVDEDDADDQWFLAWGIESRHYDTTDPANKKLFFQAEDLTELSTTTTAAGASGASGSGSNVQINTDLTTTYQAILSTEIDASNTHLGHIGTYRVWARLHRPASNTGAVDVALEWAEGDFRRFTQNTAVSYEAGERESVWTLADLGLVNLTKVAQGTQRWEGRIIARSTAVGDELQVDCLFLFPVNEGYGEVRGVLTQPVLTSFSARDEFDQTAGALTGKTLPVGGTWTAIASSDADDFNVSGSGTVTRSAVSDADLNTGRYVSAGTTNYTNVTVAADVTASGNVLTQRQGVFARLVDINNWLMVVQDAVTVETARIRVLKRIGGTVTELGGESGHGTTTVGGYKLSLTVLGSQWAVSFRGVTLLEGQDSDLLAGGALDDGRVGIYDAVTAAAAGARTFDNFTVNAAQSDAALFASQSLELRHDRVIREDSAGAIWTPVSDYEGSFLLVPPAGPEDRQSRLILKASRGLPESGSDGGIDDLSARMTVTPRYLQIPG